MYYIYQRLFSEKYHNVLLIYEKKKKKCTEELCMLHFNMQILLYTALSQSIIMSYYIVVSFIIIGTL